MKNLTQYSKIFMSFLLLLLQNSFSFAAEESNYLKNLPSVQYMLSNANLGTEFYLAIPQNDIKTGQREEILAVYICSFTDTKVTIKNEYFQFERTKEVKAFEPTFFTSKKGDLNFSWEVDKSEEVGNNCFSLIADDPIAVMVLNSRQLSSDSYLAIPTSAWGKKYVHAAYYDHNEGFPTYIKRGAGFIIVSAFDGTSVHIKLNGTGEGNGQTVEKHKIGDEINISLRKGEEYMIRGDGSTDLGFDLTGSIIESNNPIGVISFHQRTMIPNQCTNGRDHICEMLTPVQSWGTDFVTMEFDRNGQGDFFRVIAIEDNTKLTADQYYPGSGNPIPDGHIVTTLNKGQFWEYLQSSCGSNNKQNGVRGVTVWHATKPVMLMQYAYSYPWDGDRNWDPLMILVPPISQFQQSVVFQTPVESDFHTHQITFFAIGNPNDPDKKLLNSIYFDGEKLSDLYPQFLYNRIPNTNIFWGRLAVDIGTHYITSETKLAGYLTGFSGFNSYGNPFIMGTNKIDALDTLPPEFIYNYDDCGTYNYTVFESRNAFNDPNPQKDQGIKSIYMLKEISYNFSYELEKPDRFKPSLGIYEQNIILHVNNLDSNAKAYFIIMDRAGNSTIDSVEYIAPGLQQNPNIDFGKLRMYQTKELTHKISNTSTIPLSINDIKLKNSREFQLMFNDTISFPYELLPGDSMILKISYNPNEEKNDIDTLIIDTKCKSYKSIISGQGVAPKIAVSDWNAGSIEVGSKICFEDIQGEGLRISNDGSDTLYIYGTNDLSIPFLIENPNPEFPFKIAPNEIVYFKSICFAPQDTGTFEDKLIFHSNNLGGDSVCTLKGRAFIKVDVNDYNEPYNNISINPNPLNNNILNINLTLNEFSKIEIEVYNNQGMKVFSNYTMNLNKGKHKLPIVLTNFSTGLYLLSVNINNHTFTRKFILMN